MDEPTSALSDKEVKVLYKIIRRLTKEGVSVLFISHKLEEVFDLADRVTIFRDGHMVEERNVGGLTMEELINGIAGRKVENLYPKAISTICIWAVLKSFTFSFGFSSISYSSKSFWVRASHKDGI